MVASSREATISVTGLVTQLDCKLPSNFAGDPHDAYAKQRLTAWFWNRGVLGYADRVKLWNVDPFAGSSTFQKPFPQRRFHWLVTKPSESVCPTSVAVHVPEPEKKLPVKLRLIVSSRTEVVIREAKVRMQGPSVRWFLSSLTT